MAKTQADTTAAPAPSGRRSDTREVILKTALALFADRGYDATSMREIGEQIGISKPALYYHFDSKEDIVRAIMGDLLAQMEELVAWTRAQEPAPELPVEVVSRWSAIVQANGSAMFRFMMGSHSVLREVQGDKHGTLPYIDQLATVLAAPDASVEEQLRLRLALMSVNVAGIIGLDIDAPDDEILAAARTTAISLLP